MLEISTFVSYFPNNLEELDLGQNNLNLRELTLCLPKLTQLKSLKLDKINIDFNQEILNEIVLWKVNRYAEFENSTLLTLNEINKYQHTDSITQSPKLNEPVTGLCNIGESVVEVLNPVQPQFICHSDSFVV